MLAKLWKKVLLAVCIVACIFNIMSKLVNRTSLEANLNSANDGNVVFDIFTKKDNDIKQEANNNDKVIKEENVIQEQINTEPEVTDEGEEEQSSGGVKFTDFIVEF